MAPWVNMITIDSPRTVFDRRAIAAKLEAHVSWSGYGPDIHSAIMADLKTALETGVSEIRRRFEMDGIDGMQSGKAQAYLVDQMMRTIFDFATNHAYPSANPTKGEQIAILATGGYGRRVMAPYSDVDLMFLHAHKLTPRIEQLVEFVLYALWDLGLKVGHATRSIEEALRRAKGDVTICTSLLESRWIWGDKALAQTFRTRFFDEVVAGSGPAYVEAKLAERDQRHERVGDARYVLEPNVKDGKGGLRDLQTLFWIAKYLYRVDSVTELVGLGVLTNEDAREFKKAETFLWTVRSHLHYLAGRPEERLTFDVQSDLGVRMGYADRAGVRGVERFMKHYFLTAKTIGNLTRVLCAVLEDQHKKKPRFRLPGFGRRKSIKIDGFKVDGDRLTVDSPDVLTENPVNMVRLFREAHYNALDIHPEAIRLVKQSLKKVNKAARENAEANAYFMDILTAPKRNPDSTLMGMNESGLFGKFLPDFGRVVAQMQYDMYHVYTVDEHTIRAIGILHRIEAGELLDDHPYSSKIIHEVQSRRVLYLAVLLHDIAKGRGGDHSELGAQIAKRVGPRMGLEPWETETVSWLVLHHLLMSNTAFKRDIDDPKTISDFTDIVQSPERLRLLLILTAVDIRAVGPKVWNAWKAGLLRDLYDNAQAALSGGVDKDRRKTRIERAQSRLQEALQDWPAADLASFVETAPPGYWLTHDTQTQAAHAALIQDAKKSGEDVVIQFENDDERAATQVTIYTSDHPGLFASIAGAMALAGASVVGAKISTFLDGTALDVFWVQDDQGGPFQDEQRGNRLKQRIQRAMRGEILPARELAAARNAAVPSRTKVFTVPPRVLIDNNASTNHTVIEINGRNRLGLLLDLTAILTAQGLQISNAIISTYGERAVDVFYVKDIFGLKINSDTKLTKIRKALTDALTPAETQSKKPTKKPSKKTKTASRKRNAAKATTPQTAATASVPPAKVIAAPE